MIATIVVEGLQVTGVIGVDHWERNVRQQLWIDIRLEVDIAAAVAEDDVSKALDYGALSNLIAAEVEDCEFQLLESLAAYLLELVQRTYDPLRCELTVHKPGAVPAARDIHVTVRST